MSSRFDDDVEARLVSTPSRYNFGARGPVMAAPVEQDGQVVGYVFHGVEGEEDAAGVLADLRSDFAQRGIRHWSALLKDLHAREIPAAEAVQSLLGAEGPDGAGHVGRELERVESKTVLDLRLNPQKADASRRGEESTRPATVGRAEIDAALGGEAPMSDAVSDQVAKLDFAVTRKPTPDALVVAVTSAVARIPEVLESGATVREPGYLITYLAPKTQKFPGAETVMWLQVPAGTPALFQEPRIPGDPGTLILGRGLEWQADRIFTLDGQRIITARVTDRGPLAA